MPQMDVRTSSALASEWGCILPLLTPPVGVIGLILLGSLEKVYMVVDERGTWNVETAKTPGKPWRTMFSIL